MLKDIIIYHTNDMHGRLATQDDDNVSIGIPKIAKIVNLSLLKNNTFWFDAGDLSHGTPRMATDELDMLINTLNPAPLDAVCTGNHDYNFGVSHLLQLSRGLNTYFLSANTIDKQTGAPILLPYMVYHVDLNRDNFLDEDGNSNDSTRDDIQIGVFGLSTPETAYKTNPKNVETVEFADPILIAKKMVETLRSTCHVIIALTHLGLDNSSEYTGERLAKEVDGIDLIIDGHSHTVLEEGMKVNNTLIVQAGSHGHYLGRVVITLDNRTQQITNMAATLLNEQQVNMIAGNADTFLEHRLEELDEITNAKLDHVVAHTPEPILGYRELVRCRESQLGDLVADAVRWETKADIAVINGGTLRTGLPEGDITLRDLISVFPFGSSILVAEVTGKTIKDMLEHSVFSTPEEFGGFLNVSGLTFSFDPKAEVGHKVRSIAIKNQELEETKVYTLAIVDFLFAGGDDYTMLKDLKIIDKFSNIENIVAGYLNKKGTNVKIGRIKEG